MVDAVGAVNGSPVGVVGTAFPSVSVTAVAAGRLVADYGNGLSVTNGRRRETNVVAEQGKIGNGYVIGRSSAGASAGDRPTESILLAGNQTANWRIITACIGEANTILSGN